MKQRIEGLLIAHMKNFDARLIGLTGTDAQISAIAKAYKVYYQAANIEKDRLNYEVDHSGFLYLMDPKGDYLKHFPHSVTRQMLYEEIVDIL